MNDAKAADELQIRNVLAQLAHAADTASNEDLDAEYLGYFTEDALWEAGESMVATFGNFKPQRRGRADIKAGVIERRKMGFQGPGANGLHFVMTSKIELSGDSATAESGYIFIGNARTAPQITASGMYYDTFRRDGGVWRLAHRKMVHP